MRKRGTAFFMFSTYDLCHVRGGDRIDEVWNDHLKGFKKFYQQKRRKPLSRKKYRYVNAMNHAFCLFVCLFVCVFSFGLSIHCTMDFN